MTKQNKKTPVEYAPDVRCSGELKMCRIETTIEQLALTEESLKLMRELVRDAGNWNGTPLVDGNVHIGKARRGNLTDLKRHGLVTTFESDALMWVGFTPLAEELFPELKKFG